MRPTPGNHDYATLGAVGYFRYFGSRAGPKRRGYYGFDAGTRCIYALDSNCRVGGKCRKGSAQSRWLKADLERNPKRCVMAVLHHPHFSSGRHGTSGKTMPLVRLLYRAGAEIIVNAHDHVYERFAPDRSRGTIDREHGTRQFIVGTGGAPLYSFKSSRPAHSRKRNRSTYGVLKLVLEWDRHTWKILPAGKGTFTDSGKEMCHDPPPATGS